MSEVEIIRRRIDKIGDATGVLFSVDGNYVGLGALVEQMVRAVLKEGRPAPQEEVE
jgi:hypothetical protein